jgi:hypothetical protein
VPKTWRRRNRRVTLGACLVALMKRWKRGVSPRGIGPGPKMRANDPSITLSMRARSGHLTEAHPERQP